MASLGAEQPGDRDLAVAHQARSRQTAEQLAPARLSRRDVVEQRLRLVNTAGVGHEDRRPEGRLVIAGEKASGALELDKRSFQVPRHLASFRGFDVLVPAVQCDQAPELSEWVGRVVDAQIDQPFSPWLAITRSRDDQHRRGLAPSDVTARGLRSVE